MRSYLIKYGVKEEVTYLGFFKVAEDRRFVLFQLAFYLKIALSFAIDHSTAACLCDCTTR